MSLLVVRKCRHCGNSPALRLVVEATVICGCPECGVNVAVSTRIDEAVSRWNSLNGGPLVGNEPFYVSRDLVAFRFDGAVLITNDNGGYARRKTNQIVGI